MDFQKELEACLLAGSKAAAKVMEIYNDLSFEVETKSDDSPVTTADLAANAIILETLKKHFPQYPILSEETVDDLERLNSDSLFIVDPIDGTKDFIAHNDEFCINIAFAYKHEAVVGVVVIPALDKTYYAVKGKGAYLLDNKTKTLTRIHVSSKTSDLTCLTSRFFFCEEDKAAINRHLDKISAQYACGSAYKMCRIAEGKAEIVLRMRPGTKEWDTAAPQVVVEEAGGLFLTIHDLKPITYNRSQVKNVHPYIICNRKENILF